MKLAILTVILVFLALFAATTFPQSESYRQKATNEQFTPQDIDSGWRLATQRRLIFWTGTFVTLGFLLVVACTGRARRLADRFGRWSGGRWWLTVLLMGAFCFAALELLRLPVAVIGLLNYQAWGLIHQSVGDWLIDRGKSLGLQAALGTVLLLGLYTLIRWSPRWWWLPAATLGGLVAVAVTFILPLWVEPMFNTFTPLAEYKGIDSITKQRLEAAIRKLADQAQVPVDEVLVMDASRRGTHSNAYFTGFGSSRRIVLYDTLLTHHENHPEEIISIIGHEIGHWRYHHILIGLALGTGGLFVALFLLSVILRWAVGRWPFLLSSPADPAGWPLILLLAFLGSWLIMPLENAISRQFERQADWTALELTGQPDVFIAAEKRLAEKNIGNLVPGPIAVFWFADHPPTVERIQMAHDWQQRQ